MGKYLGNYVEDGGPVYLWWSSVDSNGGSVAPAVAGTTSVYKNDNATQTIAGVMAQNSFEGLAGVNLVVITITDAFYVANEDYSVVLSAATIDGETVNSILGQFSIEKRVTDITSISQSDAAADNLQNMLTGVAGTTLTLDQLRINANIAGGAIDIDNTGGPGIRVDASTFGALIIAGDGNNGVTLQGEGAGAGLAAIGGTEGNGITALGGATSGNGLHAEAQTDGSGIEAVAANNDAGIKTTGAGGQSGILATGGPEGDGIEALGGVTSGDGIHTEAQTDGRGIEAIGKNSAGISAMGDGGAPGIGIQGGATGHGIEVLGGATSGDGIHAEAPTDGDGIDAVGSGAGVDIRGDITGDITGSIDDVNNTVDSNLVEMGGVAQSATDLKDFADDGYDPITNSVEQVKINDDAITVNDILTADIDSTGVATTLKKAVETILAIVGGIASYNETTGVWTVKGRDGTTTIYLGTVTDEGTRTVSVIS